MPMKPPRFWTHQADPYAREAAPLTRALLSPFSQLYRAGFALRKARSSPQSVTPYVICVGNLTVGGAGKTPLVRHIRRALAGQGLRVASLSRGYGGQLKGPLKIDPGKHTAIEVGDEPLMLAQDGESWIGADRYGAAIAMQADGVAVILMDDGYQNWALKKDYNIIVFDAGDPIGNGHLIPKGPLREPVKHGLARADVAVFMGEPAEHMRSWKLVDTPRLDLKIATKPFDTSRAYVAFAGIGRPQKFFDSLASVGADVREAVSYSDHYIYKASDLDFLRKLANEHKAHLVTTEKDWLRLSPTDRADIAILEIGLESTAALDLWLTELYRNIQNKPTG